MSCPHHPRVLFLSEILGLVKHVAVSRYSSLPGQASMHPLRRLIERRYHSRKREQIGNAKFSRC
jgi:hypothetical protein